jgi:putative DNA primase/helicase
VADVTNIRDAIAPTVIDITAPYDVAQTFGMKRFVRGNDRTLHFHRGEFFEWVGSHYRPLEDEALRSRLYPFLAKCVQQKTGRSKKDEAPKFVDVPVKPNLALTANVIGALKAAVYIDQDIEAPAWLRPGGEHHPIDLIACRNALLHWPTEALLDHTPAFFNLGAVEFDYQPDAPQPDQWLEFLDQLWPGDAESIATLQEIFGLALIDDVSFQKIFLLVGPLRSGKGTIARVLERMIGSDNTVAPTLNSLAGEFGLQPLIGKKVAVIGDARIGSRDTAVLVERLLSISGEDLQTINRKNRTQWTGRLRLRFIIISNELPDLRDTSGALTSRMIILSLTNSFYGKEDHGLAKRLFAEMPGILNWSLIGLRRLREHGHFVPPKASEQLVEQLDRLSSPMRAFLNERCDIGPEYEDLIDFIFSEWQGWCQSQGRERAGDKPHFGKHILSAQPGLKVVQHRDGTGKQERYYQGVRVKP